MRIGIIGVGRMGETFARALHDHEDVTGLVLAGSRPGSADDLASALGAEAVDDAPTATDRADAMVIAAATAAHGELIRLAARAGKPTFCEKPIALDLDATDAALAAVAEAGIPFQVGFHRRFDPGFAAARHAVVDGRVGDVYTVRSISHDPEPSHEAFIPTSGGMYRDLMVHDFDIARWVTGLRIETVFAMGNPQALPIYAPYDDVGVAGALMQFEGGAVGVVTAARHNPAGHEVRMEVHGSKDSITVGLDRRTPLNDLGTGTNVGVDPHYESFVDRFTAAYTNEMHAFVDYALGRIPNPCPPDEARDAFVAALAAERSAREHRPVAVEEIG